MAQDLPIDHRALAQAFDQAVEGEATGLATAARELQRIGARPGDGQVDRAGLWQQSALELDPAAMDALPPLRGRVKGPAYRESRLAAGASETLDEVFYAGEATHVSAVARTGRAQVTVTDPDSGTAVCELVAADEPASCGWTPLYTMPYSIRVTNMSGEPLDYLLITD